MHSPRMSEPYFLDTNAIVYAMGQSAEASSATQALEKACRRIVQAIGVGEISAVSHLIVLQELVYLLTRWHRRGQGPQMPQVQRVVHNVIALCQNVYTPTLAELGQALQGYDPKQHDFNDRLIIQAMQIRGVTRILTADQGFDQVKEVTRVDPMKLAEQLAERNG